MPGLSKEGKSPQAWRPEVRDHTAGIEIFHQKQKAQGLDRRLISELSISWHICLEGQCIRLALGRRTPASGSDDTPIALRLNRPSMLYSPQYGGNNPGSKCKPIRTKQCHHEISQYGGKVPAISIVHATSINYKYQTLLKRSTPEHQH